MQSLLDRGELVEVAADVVYLRETYDELVAAVRAMIAEHGAVTVAGYRDRFRPAAATPWRSWSTSTRRA